MISDAKTQAIEEEKQIGTGLKILTPKQMLQRLPVALAQVKAGNISENLLNQVRWKIYSLCQSKEITKKACNNLMKSIQWNCIQWNCAQKIAFRYKWWILYLWTQKIVKLLHLMF